MLKELILLRETAETPAVLQGLPFAPDACRVISSPEGFPPWEWWQTRGAELLREGYHRVVMAGLGGTDWDRLRPSLLLALSSLRQVNLVMGFHARGGVYLVGLTTTGFPGWRELPSPDRLRPRMLQTWGKKYRWSVSLVPTLRPPPRASRKSPPPLAPPESGGG